MSLYGDIASFNTGTGIAGTTIDVPLSLGGLAPKVIWCLMVGRTETTDAAGAGDAVESYGFGVSNSSYRALASRSSDGVTPSATSRVLANNGIVVSLSSSDTINGRLSINALSADEAQFIVDVQFPASYRVYVLALAGTDLTDASIADLTLNNAVSTTDLVVGHGCKYAEVLTANGSAVNTVAASTAIAIGRGIDGPVNHILSTISFDNSATSDTYSYGADSGITARIVGATLDRRYSYAGSHATGCTFSAGSSAGALVVSALVLNGTFRVDLGDFNTATGPTVTEIDNGYVPVVTTFWSAIHAKSTAPNSDANGALSIGWALGQFGSKQVCMSFEDRDNQPTTVVTTAQSDGGGITYYNLASGSIEAIGGVISPGDPGPTVLSFQSSTPDASPMYMMWAMFGEAGEVPPASPPPPGAPRSWLNRNFARW